MTRSPYEVAAGLVIGVLTLLGTVACAPASQPLPEPIASESSTPVFASEEEAMAAAEKLYTEYLRVSDAVTSGDAEPGAIEPFVTAEELEHEQAGFASLAAEGLQLVGATTPYNFGLESADLAAGSVRFYVCLDLSQSRTVDASGADVTATNLVDQQPFLVEAVTQEQALLIDSHESWSGENFC